MMSAMHPRWVAVALAAVGVLGFAVATGKAEPRKQTFSNEGHRAPVTHHEKSRQRTRIIIRKRSYLDPGTEPLPSGRNTLDYIQLPNQRADDPLDNSAYGGSGQTALPGPWTLPGKHNPWLDFNR